MLNTPCVVRVAFSTGPLRPAKALLGYGRRSAKAHVSDSAVQRSQGRHPTRKCLLPNTVVLCTSELNAFGGTRLT